MPVKYVYACTYISRENNAEFSDRRSATTAVRVMFYAHFVAVHVKSWRLEHIIMTYVYIFLSRVRFSCKYYAYSSYALWNVFFFFFLLRFNTSFSIPIYAHTKAFIGPAMYRHYFSRFDRVNNSSTNVRTPQPMYAVTQRAKEKCLNRTHAELTNIYIYTYI